MHHWRNHPEPKREILKDPPRSCALQEILNHIHNGQSILHKQTQTLAERGKERCQEREGIMYSTLLFFEHVFYCPFPSQHYFAQLEMSLCWLCSVFVDWYLLGVLENSQVWLFNSLSVCVCVQMRELLASQSTLWQHPGEVVQNSGQVL